MATWYLKPLHLQNLPLRRGELVSIATYSVGECFCQGSSVLGDGYGNGDVESLGYATYDGAGGGDVSIEYVLPAYETLSYLEILAMVK